MDQTKRPLLIPPEFANYAEKYGIFEMYKRLIEQLIVTKPADPLNFMVELLKRENDDVPQIVILGPPCSGKKTISNMICSKMRTAHITSESLVEEADLESKKAAKAILANNQAIPTEMWIKLITARLQLFDCIRKGWVMDGFPQTKEQSQALQAIGVYPKHVVLLDAPDTVLIERAAGKRVDPKTGDIYHVTFDPPQNSAVEERLEKCSGCDEESLVEKLVVYHRHIEGIISCYGQVMKTINADQPKGDVFAQAFTFLCNQVRSAAPHTPRIILMGPTGAGKGVQAALVASKYNIVNVSMGQLLKQAVADDSKIGNSIKSFVEKNQLVPDSFVMTVLKERLSQLDCVSRGWVLHGFPKNRDQAEQLVMSEFVPNRVFFLDVPTDSIIERLTLRASDPITGERYHMLYNPPRTQEVRDRLQQNPKDNEEAVRSRLSGWSAYLEELLDYYDDGQHINADQDPHTVFENIESMIVNPLPKKYEV